MGPRRLRALVLDDEEDLTFLVSHVLEFNRFEVEAVNRPGDAIAALKRTTFDLLITDFKMDDMDGLEVISEVRGKLGLVEMKIILLTFRDFSEEELRAVSRDSVVYLKKPFLPNELVQRIETLFS